jgi:hypothetical protein
MTRLTSSIGSTARSLDTTHPCSAIIAADCVMDRVEPAPNRIRYEGCERGSGKTWLP